MGASLGLIWTLVRTDFKVRYHGTLAGFVWALLKPLTMFLVLMAVFSFIFASAPNYRLNLILGLFLWDFFAEATKVGLVSLHAKSYLLTKTRFPRWIVVVTSCANPLVTLMVFFVLVLGALTVAGHPPGPGPIALFLLYLLQFVLMVVGISLAGSVRCLRYRDLNQVWEVITQAGFFVAPIVFPIGILPERLHRFLYLWPPTPVIQYSRMALIEAQVPSLRAHALLAAVTATVLLFGILVFRRYSARAAEWL
jgi:lipopolysaccharide transport system permease protein